MHSSWECTLGRYWSWLILVHLFGTDFMSYIWESSSKELSILYRRWSSPFFFLLGQFSRLNIGLGICRSSCNVHAQCHLMYSEKRYRHLSYPPVVVQFLKGGVVRCNTSTLLSWGRGKRLCQWSTNIWTEVNVAAFFLLFKAHIFHSLRCTFIGWRSWVQILWHNQTAKHKNTSFELDRTEETLRKKNS